jgi:hypothetical protein
MLHNRARQCALKIPSRVARTTERLNFPAFSPPCLLGASSFAFALSRVKSGFVAWYSRSAHQLRACPVLWIAFRSTPSARRRRRRQAPFHPPPHASHARYSCVFLHAHAINFQWHPLYTRVCFYAAANVAVLHLRLVEPRAGCTPAAAAIYFANCQLPVPLENPSETIN